MIRANEIYLMHEFHHKTYPWSDSPDCFGSFEGDKRGVYDWESESWTPWTEKLARSYWEKCTCGLRKAVESILTAREEEADNNMRNVGY